MEEKKKSTQIYLTINSQLDEAVKKIMSKRHFDGKNEFIRQAIREYVWKLTTHTQK